MSARGTRQPKQRAAFAGERCSLRAVSQPYLASSVHVAGFASAAKRLGLMEKVLPLLAPATRHVLDHPFDEKWVSAHVIQDLTQRIAQVHGAEALDPLNFAMTKVMGTCCPRQCSMGTHGWKSSPGLVHVHVEHAEGTVGAAGFQFDHGSPDHDGDEAQREHRATYLVPTGGRLRPSPP